MHNQMWFRTAVFILGINGKIILEINSYWSFWWILLPSLVLAAAGRRCHGCALDSENSSSCRAAGLNKDKMMACPLAETRAAPAVHRTSDSNSIIRRLTGDTRESAQSNNSRQTRTHYIKKTKPPWRKAQRRNICTFLRGSSRQNADKHAFNIEKATTEKSIC